MSSGGETGRRQGSSGAAAIRRRVAVWLLRGGMLAAAMFAATNALKLRDLDQAGGGAAAFFRQKDVELESLVTMLRVHADDGAAIGVWWRPEQRTPGMMDTAISRLHYTLHPVILYSEEEQFVDAQWVVHRRDDRAAFVVMLRERGWAGKLEKIARTDEWMLLRWRDGERAHLSPREAAQGAKGMPRSGHARPLPPAGRGVPPRPSNGFPSSRSEDGKHEFAIGLSAKPHVTHLRLRWQISLDHCRRSESVPLEGGLDVF